MCVYIYIYLEREREREREGLGSAGNEGKKLYTMFFHSLRKTRI